MEEKVQEAGESTGKHDDEKKSKVRRQRAFEKCMGVAPRFRAIG